MHSGYCVDSVILLSVLIMELSKTLEYIRVKDREDEKMTKDLLESSAKKYNLQKELETLKTKISAKRSELKRLNHEVTVLSLEAPVLEKQEEGVKHAVRNLIREIVAKDVETESIQENFWVKMNNFVSDCNWFLAKQETSAKIRNNNQTGAASEERENKIRQLKVESELEAMHLYEKYQTTKMKELKLIKDSLEKDSFVI